MFSVAFISARKGVIQNALLFRSYPLVSEEKLRRLSVEGLAVNVSEQIMQPLSVTSFQEQSAPPLVLPRLESNSPQTRDPEEDLLCIARTFSFLRESGKDPIGTCDTWNKNLLYDVKSAQFLAAEESIYISFRAAWILKSRIPKRQNDSPVWLAAIVWGCNSIALCPQTSPTQLRDTSIAP